MIMISIENEESFNAFYAVGGCLLLHAFFRIYLKRDSHRASDTQNYCNRYRKMRKSGN